MRYYLVLIIMFIMNDTALHVLKYINHVQKQYCKLGNSHCLFESKGVVRLVYTTTRCKLHSYTMIYTSTRHDVMHSISLLSSFALRAYKDSDTYY